MKPYSPEILDNIKREIEFIFAAQKLHYLEGKMRVYTPRTQENWKSQEAGFELWFGPNEIDLAISKLKLFYREGKSGNTAFFLDPVIYNLSGSKPVAVGTSLIWCTLLCPDGKEIEDEAVNRVKKLGLLADFIEYNGKARSGLKILGALKEPTKPAGDVPPDGSYIPGIQELADLVNISCDPKLTKNYMLSGINYNAPLGHCQHENFQKIFGDKKIAAAKDLIGVSIHLQKIVDAGKCWNAYGRDPAIYARYGIDVKNLASNLKRKSESDSQISEVKKEILLILQANSKLGLNGEMRLYTAPEQNNWRSKEEGVEVWFDEKTIDEAIRKTQYYYNAGLLPNSPLLLDPIMYKKETDGSHIPVGCGVVWATALFTGQQKYSEESLKRMKDIGLLTGLYIRAGTEPSGLKILGFLDKPYIFSQEEIEKFKQERVGKTKTHDVIPVPGCKEIFNIAACNGESFWPYYLLSGMEYLCTNGAFSCSGYSENFGDDDKSRDDMMKKFAVSKARIDDANKCWDSYDKLHLLWERFGIDVPNLESNLVYFNLCGRDLKLFGMTGEARADKEAEFEFFAPGWIPKAAITVIGATGGTGKSSLAHRLAILASIDWRDDEPNPKWLGSEIPKENCKGIAIYFSGEDSPAIVNARAKMVDPTGRSKRLLLKCSNDFPPNDKGEPGRIGDFLNFLQKLPEVSIVVIDPARKYLVGDENDSEVVSEFFEAIEKFAVNKNCPVVVVHHLAKEAHPRDTRDILDLLRGSQVFIDRPRVVIGLMRDGAHTVAGLAKNNIPPKLGMVEGERIFVRDPGALDLFWLPGPEGVRTFTVSEAELEQMKQEREAKEKEGKK